MSDSQRECIDWWVAKAGRLEAEIEQLRKTLDAVRELPEKWRKWRHNPHHPLVGTDVLTADVKDCCADELEDILKNAGDAPD